MVNYLNPVILSKNDKLKIKTNTQKQSNQQSKQKLIIKFL
jgi:hypothetical protein